MRIFVAAHLLFGALVSAANADWVVMADGREYEVLQYEVQPPLVLMTGTDGRRYSARLAHVDLEASRAKTDEMHAREARYASDAETSSPVELEPAPADLSEEPMAPTSGAAATTPYAPAEPIEEPEPEARPEPWMQEPEPADEPPEEPTEPFESPEEVEGEALALATGRFQEQEPEPASVPPSGPTGESVEPSPAVPAEASVIGGPPDQIAYDEPAAEMEPASLPETESEPAYGEPVESEAAGSAAAQAEPAEVGQQLAEASDPVSEQTEAQTAQDDAAARYVDVTTEPEPESEPMIAQASPVEAPPAEARPAPVVEHPPSEPAPMIEAAPEQAVPSEPEPEVLPQAPSPVEPPGEIPSVAAAGTPAAPIAEAPAGEFEAEDFDLYANEYAGRKYFVMSRIIDEPVLGANAFVRAQAAFDRRLTETMADPQLFQYLPVSYAGFKVNVEYRLAEAMGSTIEIATYILSGDDIQAYREGTFGAQELFGKSIVFVDGARLQ